MDYFHFRFFEKLERSIRSFSKTMSVLVSRLRAVIQYFQTGEAALKAELATAQEALAAALANDAADAETIAAAKAEAEAARAAADEAAAKASELQSLVDADTEEDEAITALLDSVELPS